MLHTDKSFVHTRWLKYLSYFILLLLLLLFLLVISIPTITRWGIISWFEANGYSVTMSSLDTGLLQGRYSITGLDATHVTGERLLVGEFTLIISNAALFERRLVIQEASLHDTSISLKHDSNGVLSVSGLPVEASAPGPETDNRSRPSSAVTPLALSLNKLRLSGLDVCYQQSGPGEEAQIGYCLQLDNAAWKGSVTFRPDNTGDDPASPAVIAKGQLALNDLHIRNQVIARSLLRSDSIIFEGLRFQTPADFQLDKFIITGLRALETDSPAASDSPVYVLDWETASIDALRLESPNSLQIRTITIIKPSVYIHIDRDGGNDITPWLAAIPSDTQATNDTKRFDYRLDRLSITNSGHLSYVDSSIEPPFSVTLDKAMLDLTGLDTSAPEQAANLSFNAVIGDHGKIMLDAEVTPLAKQPTFDGEGKINALDLRSFSTLTRHHLGHSIRSGQLDADMTLKADNGVLDSKLMLVLHQFELRPLSNNDAEKLDTGLGLPLNTSISLLRDRDNSIKLEIPVSGDIGKPEFSPANAIRKATSKAITAAVINYYTPFGLVYATGSIIDLATALRFEPLLFDPGSSRLTDAHKEQLDRVADMLSKRPGITMTICGYSNQSDRDTLFQLPPNNAISSQQQANLVKIAEQRSTSARDYLLDTDRIEAGRLVLCEPEYSENENAVSGVELKI